MNLPVFGCSKFQRLLSELEDRELTESEGRFLDDHRSKCSSCSQTEDSMHSSLNMLREAAFDVEPERSFDRRVLRKLQVQTVKDGFAYWKPALIGCTIAFIAIFTSLDLLAARTTQSSIKIPAGQASREVYPKFELTQPPHLDR